MLLPPPLRGPALRPHDAPAPPLPCLQPPAGRRRLQEEPDGYCDESRYSEDPDCGGGGASCAGLGPCACGAALAYGAGFPGYCVYDQVRP